MHEPLSNPKYLEQHMWQKIETAPKDGKTEILLFTPSEIFVGVRPTNCPDDAAADLMGSACYPSHWMPLPPPPDVSWDDV